MRVKRQWYVVVDLDQGRYGGGNDVGSREIEDWATSMMGSRKSMYVST